MSGLYQRALDFLQSQRRLRLVRPDDDDYGSFEGTPEEQQQIEGEIQRAVQENRLDVGPDTFRVRPQRRGAGLPVIVNIAAVLLIVAGVYVLLELFDNQEANLVTRTASVSSAEGRLLSALRVESEQQLSAKEAQIAAIEGRLAAAEAEREQIRANASTALAEQEAELRTEFEAALEAERQRLLGLDLSEAEREERLAAFRETRRSELEQSLAALEARAAEELAEREEALAAVVDEFESSLQAAQQERVALEAELAEREAELESQFEQRAAELSDERAAAATLLEQLRAQQESRQLVLDQILGYYTRIRTSLDQGELDEAAASLASLRTYLEEGPATALPELQRRRQVELFLVGALEEQLARARGEQDMDMTSLVESAGLLAEVNELVAQADASYASADLTRARELYVAALSQIPAVALGYERLQEIETASLATQSEQITGLLAAGNERYLAGDYAAAAQRYGEAIATLPLPDDEVVGRILDAGYQIQAADSLAELASLRDELAARADELAARTDELAAARAARTRAEAETERIGDELTRAEALIETRDETIESQEGQLVTLRDRIQGVDELIAEQRERAEAAEAELEATEETLATTTEALATSRESLAETEGSLATTRQTLATTRQTLATTQETLAQTRDELERVGGERDEMEGQLAALQERVDEHRRVVDRIERFQAVYGRSDEPTSDPVDQLELLETKLLILRIVGSDAIRADYPDLYDQLNAYLDALVAEQRAAATDETMREINRLLTDLTQRTDDQLARIDSFAEEYPLLGTTERTTDFFSRLRSASELR